MEAMTRVLIVDDAASTRRILRSYLEGEAEVVGEAGNGMEAIQLAEELRPDVVLMDLSMPRMGGLEATERILVRVPGCEVVVVSILSDWEAARKAMAAGARDYLRKPVCREELRAVLRRLRNREPGRELLLPHDEPASGTWAFVGAGGGGGRTTTLLGLAGLLHAQGKRVVVVDLDHLFGDCAFHLGLAGPEIGLPGLLQEPRLEGADLLEHYLVHHSSGLPLLAGPATPLAGGEPDWSQLGRVFDLLEEHFDYVLADMPTGLPAETLEVLDRARLVVPVAALEPSRLKSLRVLVGLLREVGYPEEKLQVLVRRHGAGDELSWLEHVGVEVARILPHDPRTVRDALRRGKPVSEEGPDSELVVALEDFLATQGIGVATAPAPEAPGASEGYAGSWGWLAAALISLGIRWAP